MRVLTYNIRRYLVIQDYVPGTVAISYAIMYIIPIALLWNIRTWLKRIASLNGYEDPSDTIDDSLNVDK